MSPPGPRLPPLAAVAAALPFAVGGPWSGLAGVAADAEAVAGAEVPEPYRGLLVHDEDMTSTLARFHGEPIDLRVLEQREDDGVLRRRVTLVTRRRGTVVELGAIAIALDAFAAAARAAVRAGATPLGAILGEHAVPFVSRPRGFFRLPATVLAAELHAALETDGAALLWGRLNRLTTPAGELLAEVVEILPPLPDAAAG